MSAVDFSLEYLVSLSRAKLGWFTTWRIFMYTKYQGKSIITVSIFKSSPIVVLCYKVIDRSNMYWHCAAVHSVNLNVAFILWQCSREQDPVCTALLLQFIFPLSAHWQARCRAIQNRTRTEFRHKLWWCSAHNQKPFHASTNLMSSPKHCPFDSYWTVDPGSTRCYRSLPPGSSNLST